MAITQTPCTSFKLELGQAIHNFNAVGGDTFKLALYYSTATLNANTTVYTSAGEVSGTGYTWGGLTLTNIPPSISSGKALFSFVSPAIFTGVTLTCRGGLVYNSTKANRAVCVLDFGEEFTALGQDINITFPSVTPTSAFLRIS